MINLALVQLIFAAAIMKNNTNKKLVSSLQHDEKEAFDILYRKYHSAIYSNVLKLTRDAGITEDIVQEVFIALWEKRYHLDPEQEVAGWLFVVSYHKSINWLKQKLKDSLAQKGFRQPFEYSNEEKEALIIARENILEKAMEQLPPQKRKVFELCKLQRRTYEEAAEEMKISKHTVKEYLSGAILSIKEYIKQHPEHATVILIAFSLDYGFS